MSGHSKWAQIKHQKATTDAKRGQIFSKLSGAITLIAREGGVDPTGNAKLREIIAKAKGANMPSDTIERAIKKAMGADATKLESFLYEAYGPGGAALLIEGTTDNKNRSANEIKHLLSEQSAKWAEPGSVRWAFTRGEHGWEAREHSKISLSKEDQKKLGMLLETLNEHADIREIYLNAK